MTDAPMLEEYNWLGKDGLVHQLMPTGTVCGEGGRYFEGSVGEPVAAPVSCLRCLTPVLTFQCEHDAAIVRCCPLDDESGSYYRCRCCDECAMACADRDHAHLGGESPDA